MATVHDSAVEHANAAERACVLRYLALLREQLGPRLLAVHLFGSFARGDMWSADSPMRSDVDLLVLCSEQPSQAEIQNLIDATYPLFLECGRQLSPQFRTRDALEHPSTPVARAFVEGVRAEGRLLLGAADEPFPHLPAATPQRRVQW